MNKNNNKKENNTPHFRWQSMAGYDKFVSVCVGNGCQLMLTEGDWRKKKITVRTYIRIACVLCGKDDIYVRIDNFVTTGGYKCDCKKKRSGKKLKSWRGEDGFRRLETICEYRKVTPMFNHQKIDFQMWNRMSFVSSSIISFECHQCEVTVQKPLHKILENKIIFIGKHQKNTIFSSRFVKIAIAF